MTASTYTLDEARRVLALQECGRHGHSWQIIERFGGIPVGLLCDTCGERYGVTDGLSAAVPVPVDLLRRAIDACEAAYQDDPGGDYLLTREKLWKCLGDDEGTGQ